MLTVSRVEKESLIQKGFADEGIIGFISQEQIENSVPLYRLYSQSGNDHFYTISQEERDKAQKVNGYTQEGIIGYVFSSQAPSTVPVYRHFNGPNQDHLYTTDPLEHANLPDLRYGFEKIEFFVFSKEIPALLPLYRHWKPNDHFYTTNQAEHSKVIGLGYKDEGILGYVYREHQVNTVPLYRLYKGSVDDHFYCINEEEKNSAQFAHAYAFEGVIGYVYPQQNEGTIPVYRHWNGVISDHFYTIDKQESDQAVKLGWTYEKIEYYLLPQPQIPDNLVPEYITEEYGSIATQPTQQPNQTKASIVDGEVILPDQIDKKDQKIRGSRNNIRRY